jgi:hypothetical protein
MSNCQRGCGHPIRLATRTTSRYIGGQPLPFCWGHRLSIDRAALFLRRVNTDRPAAFAHSAPAPSRLPRRSTHPYNKSGTNDGPCSTHRADVRRAT